MKHFAVQTLPRRHSLVLESCHSVSDQSRLAWRRLCSSSRPRSAALLEGGPLPAPSTTAHVVSNKEDKKDTQKELRKMAICQDLSSAHQGGRMGALNEAFSPYCQGSSPPSLWSHAPRSSSGGGTNPRGRPAAASCPRQRRLHLSTGERVSAVHIGAASLTWPLRMKRGWRLMFCDDLHPSHPTAAQVSQLWDEKGAVGWWWRCDLRTCGASAGA